MGAISRLQSVAGHPPGLGFSQALEALKADGSLGLTPRLSDVRSSESGACCVAVCFKQARCFKRATLAENGFQTPRLVLKLKQPANAHDEHHDVPEVPVGSLCFH